MAGGDPLGALRVLDPDVLATYERWVTDLGPDRQLDPKTAALIPVALDSIAHCPGPHAFRNVHDAFEAGATIAEMVELFVRVGMLEGGIHAIREGVHVLEQVVREREADGRPTPRHTVAPPQTDPADVADPDAYYPVSATASQTFAAWQAFAPDLHAAYFDFLQKRAALRQALDKKTEELVVSAIDATILWPTLDFHFTEAFDLGCTVRELSEALVVGCRYAGGLRALEYSLITLDRVIREREAAGLTIPDR